MSIWRRLRATEARWPSPRCQFQASATRHISWIQKAMSSGFFSQISQRSRFGGRRWLSLLDQFIGQQARLHRKRVSARRIIFRGGGTALLDELPDLRPHGFFIFRERPRDAIQVCFRALKKLIG